MANTDERAIGTGTAVVAPAARPMLVSIIIPAYNERETISEALRRVRAVECEKEIIVVDDASTDGTSQILEREAGIVLVRHTDNQGKGMAIRSALRVATGDVIVVQDADLEYSPADIPRLVEPIALGAARVVYGSRFLTGRPGMRPANYLCNRLLAAAANLLYGARITDEATCYKAFDGALMRSLPLTCRRFEFCPEVTARVRLLGEPILEVPVRYEARSEDAGKKIRWWDGVHAFWTLLKYRFGAR